MSSPDAVLESRRITNSLSIGLAVHGNGCHGCSRVQISLGPTRGPLGLSPHFWHTPRPCLRNRGPICAVRSAPNCTDLDAIGLLVRHLLKLLGLQGFGILALPFTLASSGLAPTVFLLVSHFAAAVTFPRIS